MRIRPLLELALRVLRFGVVFVLAAELFFRVIVPASHPPFQRYLAEYGILCLEGSPARSSQFTVGRLARDRARWHVNDAGWNSDREYVPVDVGGEPCLALIGNSYVEGFYADVDRSLAASLESRLDGQTPVYNFGKSGVCAAQMLRVAAYARERFAPAMYVYVLNHGTLRSSVRNFGFLVSNEQYTWNAGQLQSNPPTAYRPSRFMRYHTYSALVRYLYHNARILKTRAAIQQEAVQRKDARVLQAETDEMPILTAVAGDITKRARAMAPGAKVLFVMDGDRLAMYETQSRPERLRESGIWESACRDAGCEFIDLTDAFWDSYRRDGRRLDLASNYHWDHHGMSVVADAIAGVLRASATATNRDGD